MLGTTSDDYTKFLCVVTNLLWYIDPHYNKLESIDGCTFPEVIVKNLMNFNKPSEHGHKAKPFNSSDACIKVNNLLEYLDWSYFSKPHVNLLKEHVYGICEAVSKYLECLGNQVTRTTEAQNKTEKVSSIEEFLIRKIKAVPRVDLFWSEHFSKIWELVDKMGVYEPILINFVFNGDKYKKVLFDSFQMLIEKGLSYLFKDREI